MFRLPFLPKSPIRDNDASELDNVVPPGWVEPEDIEAWESAPDVDPVAKRWAQRGVFLIGLASVLAFALICRRCGVSW